MSEAAAIVKSSRRVYLIVFSTYLYAFTNDAAISWSSPILPQLRSSDPNVNPLGESIREDEESWLGAYLSLGNIFGLLIYGYLCYKFGRKYPLASMGVVHLIAFLLYTTKSLFWFFIGRFLNGVASAAGLIIFPMYIAEICKESDRGFLLVSRQIFSGFGTLFSYAAGNYLPFIAFNLILCIFPILFIVSFLILATESPYFYIMSDDRETAKKVFSELSPVSNHQTEEDVDEIKKTVEMSEILDITDAISRKPVQRAALVVFVMFILQQLTGYMPFATYTDLIVDIRSATILVGIVIILGSIVATVLIDKMGRKKLLYISLIGIIADNVLFASYYFWFADTPFLATVYITLFFFLYNVGIAFIPQITCAVILPFSIKFKVSSIAGIIGCGAAFILTLTFLGVNRIFGEGLVILFFALCSLICLIVVAIILPETKGRTIRQIQGMLVVEAEIA